MAATDPRPVRMERMFLPRVRLLEPRLVLNATAELTALGELRVMGTEADAIDTVQLQVDAQGDLLLRDGAGSVIPIANHPDGPIGRRRIHLTRLR